MDSTKTYPVWNKKLTTLFHRFDRGDKGCVTKADIKTQIDVFQTLGSLTKEEADEITTVYDKLWQTFLNGNEKVSLDEWIEGHSCLVKSEELGSMVWDTTLKRAGILMFKAADKKRKGVITGDEFAVYLRCLGVDDTRYAKEIFANLIEGHSGEMCEGDFLKAFHDFNFNKADSRYKELMGPLY